MSRACPLPAPSGLAQWIEALLLQVEEAAARGAARALEAQRPPKMTSAELGALLGKKPGALRSWLMRTPSFPREHVGSKLLFDREAVRLWLEANK